MSSTMIHGGSVLVCRGFSPSPGERVYLSTPACFDAAPVLFKNSNHANMAKDAARCGRKTMLCWKRDRPPWLEISPTAELARCSYLYRLSYRQWSVVPLPTCLNYPMPSSTGTVMTTDGSLGPLREHLSLLPPGLVPTTEGTDTLLALGWDDLDGDDGGMTGSKLAGRMESVAWHPPKLSFRIERHGGTVLGSTRAEVQEWTVDLERRTRSVRTVGRRQVRPTQPRFDSSPLAQELAHAILAGRPDERLKWDGKDRVRVLVGKVLPARSAVKATLAGRRKRLREAVAGLVGAAGWVMARANVFEKV